MAHSTSLYTSYLKLLITSSFREEERGRKREIGREEVCGIIVTSALACCSADSGFMVKLRRNKNLLPVKKRLLLPTHPYKLRTHPHRLPTEINFHTEHSYC